MSASSFECSPARARQVRRTVEFAGKLPRITKSRKQRYGCWPPIGHKRYFLCPVRDKHSNESWNWFVKSSIPGFLSAVLKTLAAVYPDPTDRH